MKNLFINASITWLLIAGFGNVLLLSAKNELTKMESPYHKPCSSITHAWSVASVAVAKMNAWETISTEARGRPFNIILMDLLRMFVSANHGWSFC